MRFSMIAGLAVLWSVGAANAANDAPWCFRYFDGPQYSDCSYYSARECLARVTYGSQGGVCERNHRPHFTGLPR